MVGSDRALALNVEMASWKVKSCVRVQQLYGACQWIYSTTECHGSRALAAYFMMKTALELSFSEMIGQLS